MAVHLNATSYNVSNIKCTGVKQMNCETDGDLEGKLLAREAYWTAQLFTLKPYGINKRIELRSKKRVNYHN